MFDSECKRFITDYYLSFKTFYYILSLLEPPAFKKELETVEVVKGHAAKLQCEFTGTAPVDVSWLKDKKPLGTTKKQKIVTKDTVSCLEIQSFDSADVGDYQCVVSNEVGKITSKSIAKLKGL